MRSLRTYIRSNINYDCAIFSRQCGGEDLPRTTFAQRKCGAGFTLIEILVVIAIFTMLGAMALVVSMESYRGYAFRNERDMIVALLQKARSQSMSNICIGTACTGGRPHGVYLQTGSVVIFQGPSYASRDSGVDETITSRYAAASTTAGSATEVVFTQLSATTTATSTTLRDDAGHVSVISINSEGGISWTN